MLIFGFRSVVKARCSKFSCVSTRELLKKTDLESWAHQWVTAGSRAHHGKMKTRWPNSRERRRRPMERKKAPLFPCPDPQRTEWLPWSKWLVTQTLRNVTEQLQTSRNPYLFKLIYINICYKVSIQQKSILNGYLKLHFYVIILFMFSYNLNLSLMRLILMFLTILPCIRLLQRPFWVLKPNMSHISSSPDYRPSNLLLCNPPHTKLSRSYI